jgi:hypothetical protein
VQNQCKRTYGIYSFAAFCAIGVISALITKPHDYSFSLFWGLAELSMFSLALGISILGFRHSNKPMPKVMYFLVSTTYFFVTIFFVFYILDGTFGHSDMH